jgi:hypothetical protein
MISRVNKLKMEIRNPVGQELNDTPALCRRKLSIFFFAIVAFVAFSRLPLVCHYFFQLHITNTSNARTLIPMNKHTQTLPLRASLKIVPANLQD